MARGPVKLDKECVEAIAELKEWQPDWQAWESLKRQRIDDGVELAVTAEQQRGSLGSWREEGGEPGKPAAARRITAGLGNGARWRLARDVARYFVRGRNRERPGGAGAAIQHGGDNQLRLQGTPDHSTVRVLKYGA
ncbi:hypothetical protein HYALB_00002424 [Hymenoscyphus albidus]|uniref:Uncharacterized protein n=1 Tax=Hymenoscyphus albidus TaxID=595503 RepID=A0A9N9LVG0_9HELO|nr:hypothetical protein HYALB_00002424 [Hymenoscyphus albidus]